MVEFAGPARQRRITVLLRAILAIPLAIAIYFVRYALWLVLLTGWFGALATGRLPEYAASFLSARQFNRCATELAALGPPRAQLRQVHRLAVRACQGYQAGAACFTAAARFLGPDGAPTNQGKFNRLLGCGDAGINRGSDLMAHAVLDGSVIGSPG